MYRISPIRPTTTPIVYRDAFYQWEIKGKNAAKNVVKYAAAGGSDDGNKLFKTPIPKEQIEYINANFKNKFLSKNIYSSFKK